MMQPSSVILDTEIEDLEKMLMEDVTNDKQSSICESKSAVHSGDTDSSDDEDVRNFLERKYNEYGNNINQNLKNNNSNGSNELHTSRPTLSKGETINLSTSFTDKKARNNVIDKSKQQPRITSFEKYNVYTDPVFGIRITHPLISSNVLLERMQGRLPIGMNKVRYHTEQGDKSRDWVIAGVILSKSPVRNTKKGEQYSIWQISDLKGDIKKVSLFLFKRAFKDLWKTVEGMVIGLLNPMVLERKDDKVEAVLSIDNPEKVMILGQSKDLGRCKSKKKNGEQCTAIINSNACEFCIYHVKQEYGKASNRSDLLSSTAGRGLNELRNKLASGNPFATNQNISAIPARKNLKLLQKDNSRLMMLSEYNTSPAQRDIDHKSNEKKEAPISNTMKTSSVRLSAASLETSVQSRGKDIQRLKLLEEMKQSQNAAMRETCQPNINTKNNERLNSSPQMAPSNAPKIDGMHQKSFNLNIIPRLSGNDKKTIDLTLSLRQSEKSKTKAIELLKTKPLPKSNPNFLKHRGTEQGKKRALEEIVDSEANISKRAKIDNEIEVKARREKLLSIMNAKSSHTDLIEAHENDRQEKYFENLEKKEAMEEKMANTMSVPCKAVTCVQCKYIAFSASDKCRQENHTLKIRDGEKRFFKCSDCGNRTITLHKIPKISCKNCKSSKWSRTAMMSDRKLTIGNTLSIRGDEEQYIGNSTANSNINLLVPDDDGK